MTTWFRGLAMPYRLGVMLSISIICLAVYGTLRLHWFDTASEGSRLLEIANRTELLVVDVQRLEKDFMLHDLSNRDFYETGETLTLSKHKSVSNELRKQIVALADILPDTQKQTATELLRLSDQYAENFYKLVSAYRQREDKKISLDRAWQSLTDTLEADANSRTNPALLSLLLALKGDEESYLLNRQELQIDAVATDLDRLNKLVPRSERSALADAIRDYETAFKGHVLINRTIGLSEDMGFQADMRDATRAMAPLLGEVATGASSERTTATRSLDIIFYLGVLATLGFIGAGAHWLYTHRTAFAASPRPHVRPSVAEPSDEDFSTPLALVTSSPSETSALAAAE